MLNLNNNSKIINNFVITNKLIDKIRLVIINTEGDYMFWYRQ